jgi:hypothetical protein
MIMKIKNKEILFFLVAIAFISAFNYYLTYPNIRFNRLLLLTYLIDTVEGWLAWWVLRTIIIYLDQKIPYRRNALKRIVLQLFVTSIAGMMVIISLTELVSWIAKGRPPVLNFFRFDVFIILIWFFVLNGIYIGLHYYREWQFSELIREEEKKIKATGFIVKTGNHNLLIDFAEIMGFYAESGYTYLQTWNEKKYLIDKSLENTQKLLPVEIFFRLNRQYILQRGAIYGYKKTGDGKLDILVKALGAIPSTISVSRIKAIEFKKWFLIPG